MLGQIGDCATNRPLMVAVRWSGGSGMGSGSARDHHRGMGAMACRASFARRKNLDPADMPLPAISMFVLGNTPTVYLSGQYLGMNGPDGGPFGSPLALRSCLTVLPAR